MAKINLLTIHWGTSYGAVLQTYATCKLLEKCGHKVTVINLVNPKLFKILGLFSSMYIQIFESYIFKKLYLPKMTPLMFKIDESKIPEADYYIVGSDQVWNREITGDLSLNYFFNFVNDNTKRISLASSFGKINWKENDEYTSKVKEELYKFSSLSVREESGLIICKNIFSLNASTLVDPTLAWSDYSRFVKHVSPVREIFCFFMNKSTNPIAQYISKELELPIATYNTLILRFKRSPVAWLRKIYKSSLIISDSFHGIAFSIIFRKQFFVLCAREENFTRINNLLSNLDLMDRFIPSLAYLQENKDIIYKKIDYENVYKKVEQYRNEFQMFIKDNIN